MKNHILKVLPFLVVSVFGVALFYASWFMAEPWAGLLNNLAATFIAVPLLAAGYEMIRSFSHRELTRRLYHYEKMLVDRELIGALNHVQKMLYGPEAGDSAGLAEIFVAKRKTVLLEAARQVKTLQFQVGKSWKPFEKALEGLLNNALLTERLDEAHLIALVDILMATRALVDYDDFKFAYRFTGQTDDRYLVVLQPESEYKKGFLVSASGDDKYVLAEDCGYFQLGYDTEKLNSIVEFDPNKLPEYLDLVYGLVSAIRQWYNVSGKKFIGDDREQSSRLLRRP